MKYMGMPAGMWLLFADSFRKQLTLTLGYDAVRAREITEKAKREYRRILRWLPEFEKGDRFKMNIVSCALLGAFLRKLPVKPACDQVTDYYRAAMTTVSMKAFCRMAAKRKFTAKDIEGMRKSAALNAADRNPYSWNMTFHIYPDGSGYEARFTKCGICALMKELGLFEYVPAMCRLDYTMSELGRASDFVREYTLASSGPYCDCGYKKRV
jgi:hypothetical protein